MLRAAPFTSRGDLFTRSPFLVSTLTWQPHPFGTNSQYCQLIRIFFQSGSGHKREVLLKSRPVGLKHLRKEFNSFRFTVNFYQFERKSSSMWKHSLVES